jgi:hypothetical protein
MNRAQLAEASYQAGIGVVSLVVGIFFCLTMRDAFEDPDVYVSARTGMCIRVDDHSTGDSHTCADVNKSLTKYNRIVAEEPSRAKLVRH